MSFPLWVNPRDLADLITMLFLRQFKTSDHKKRTYYSGVPEHITNYFLANENPATCGHKITESKVFQNLHGPESFECEYCLTCGSGRLIPITTTQAGDKHQNRTNGQN